MILDALSPCFMTAEKSGAPRASGRSIRTPEPLPACGAADIREGLCAGANCASDSVSVSAAPFPERTTGGRKSLSDEPILRLQKPNVWPQRRNLCWKGSTASEAIELRGLVYVRSTAPVWENGLSGQLTLNVVDAAVSLPRCYTRT